MGSLYFIREYKIKYSAYFMIKIADSSREQGEALQVDLEP